MKTLLLITALFFCTGLFAQGFGDTGIVIIKGNIKNYKEKYFEYAQTGFFDNSSSSVIVDSSGNFSHSIIIEGMQQDIYLYLNNDAITFTVVKGDIINLSWDAKAFKQSFTINSAQKARDVILNVQWQRYLQFRQPFTNLQRDLYNKRDSLTDEDEYAMINGLFQKEVEFLISSGHENEDLLRDAYSDTYFKYTNVLRSKNLIPKYALKAKDIVITDSNYLKRVQNLLLVIDKTTYKSLNEIFFWKSDNYREFLYNYTRFGYLYNSFVGQTAGFNPTLDNYHMAMAVLKVNTIRDWFIVKNIVTDFNWYNFDDVENVYRMFSEELTDSSLKEILEKRYVAAATLKPGKSAPAFTLKNEAGENISLTSFKGKVVYLDFWGVGCGPCIYDIENYSQKLHAKYEEKDVVFVSICVDSNEGQWKKALEKFKMKNQVNLIAEGWTEHPVCKAYNISGIPHYFLIDKKGIIVNNNAPRMGELLSRGEHGKSEIDKALEL